jgi:hypothetical protein
MGQREPGSEMAVVRCPECDHVQEISIRLRSDTRRRSVPDAWVCGACRAVIRKPLTQVLEEFGLLD